MSKQFLPGEVARVSVSITDPAGTLSDPGAMRLMVKPVNGVVLVYVGADIVRESIGRYHVDVPIPATAAPGRWVYRWELEAPNAGAAEGVIVVQKSQVLE